MEFSLALAPGSVLGDPLTYGTYGLVMLFSPRYLYFRWKGLDRGTGNVILASVFVFSME
jgi:hypothetical protein